MGESAGAPGDVGYDFIALGARTARIGRQLLAVAICLPAVWHMATEVRLFLARVRYPSDIEWLESQSLYQAYRMAHGLVTFGPPETGYLPSAQAGGYVALLALVGRVFGLDYAIGRSLSMAALVIACALVVREIFRHEHARLHARTASILALGAVASGTPLLEGFHTLIRVDMVAMALCVLGATLLDLEQPKMRHSRIALLSLTLTAAVFTRTTTIFFVAWIIAYAFLRHAKTGLLITVCCICLGTPVLLALQLWTGGWYWMYTIGIFQRHPLYWDRCADGLRLLYEYAPFAVAVVPVALVLSVVKGLSTRSALWLGMALFALPASLLPWSKRGGFYNDFLPIAFLIGPVSILLAIDSVRALATRHPGAAARLRWVVYGGFAVFLLIRAQDRLETHDHRPLAPTQGDKDRSEELNRRVKALAGGVIVPDAPFLPVHNGNTTEQYSDMPYMDLEWADFRGADLGPYLDKINARWALVSGREVPYSATQLASRYQLVDTLSEPPESLIGDHVELRYLLERQRDEQGGHVLFDFEKPLDGWTSTGDAFAYSPTKPNPPWQNYIPGSEGNRLANSYHPDKKDTAVGTLLSPPFTIDRPHMSLRVGGGWRNGTRVELHVGGQTTHTASAIFQETETMVKVVWDVSSLIGQEAQLKIIDEDTGDWGHITCDEVALFQ